MSKEKQTKSRPFIGWDAGYLVVGITDLDTVHKCMLYNLILGKFLSIFWSKCDNLLICHPEQQPGVGHGHEGLLPEGDEGGRDAAGAREGQLQAEVLLAAAVQPRSLALEHALAASISAGLIRRSPHSEKDGAYVS